MSDAGGPAVVWVWSVSVPGPESDFRDASDSLGCAQAAAEECLKRGGGLAVVESAAVSRDPSTGRKAFAETGLKCTARLVGGQARWTTWREKILMIDFDVAVPNAARMYDYFLGGKDNYAADRQAAERLLAQSPDVTATVKDNRRFLRRAVEFAASQGIRQFIDIGSGLPTVENTHEIAQRVSPDARVLYVDNDLLVLSHARALLADNPNVAVIAGDLHEPKAILAKQEPMRHIDCREPIAVLLVAILHFADDRAYEVVDTFKRAMPGGSCLVLSHTSGDSVQTAEKEGAQKIYASASAQLYPRSCAEIARFFDGLELVEPGLVGVGDWRAPVHVAQRTLAYGGVGVKW